MIQTLLDKTNAQRIGALQSLNVLLRGSDDELKVEYAQGVVDGITAVRDLIEENQTREELNT